MSGTLHDDSPSKGTAPFQRTDLLDKPGIVGARWWQEGLSTHDPIARRAALMAIAVGGTMLVGLGALVAAVAAGGSSSDEPETTTATRNALDMQREYGWSFGATGESLTFDGDTLQPFDRSALDRMASDFVPAQQRLKRYSSPTLFQSPSALPRSVPAGDPGAVQPLREAMRTINTPAMQSAYRAGKALSSLFEGAPQQTMVIVDLPGPEAMAFAAGMADRFDPCFAFENWPHPRGVTPAHLTLAAAAFYQPLFVRALASRKQPAPAVMVLDRSRLAAYTDEASQFDNRYAARLPAAPALKELGVKHVLYVTPRGTDTVELDDLNDDFVAYAGAALDVKMIAVTDFGPDPRSAAAAEPTYYYGSDPLTHDGFWANYPWGAPPKASRTRPTNVSNGFNYVPTPRTSPLSGPSPAAIGLVPVVIAVGTGAILGAKMARSGSWNRASSGG